MDYLIRRKVFKIFGAAFHIYSPTGELVGYSKQKAFKLREDIRVYRDEAMTSERFLIQARDIIDFCAAYDVTDRATGRRVCTWKRKGFSSLFRDSWILMVDDREVASLKEDSIALALLRRVINVIPQDFNLRAKDGRLLATFEQHFNPFVFKLDVTILDKGIPDIEGIALSGGILLSAIEGRQSN